ncbi:hypothetical protein MUP77_00615 [Candidatus Bathyarchaeota archaeon]|nr:hypothetical protein [Candidatus Bathyarchaeota archaeon]
MSSYSSFSLNEWHWNYYFKRQEMRVKDQHGEHTALSGFEPECCFCHSAFKLGDRIRMHDYPYWFMHFDCWKRKVAQERQAFKELMDKRRRERQERRERLRLQNHDPPGSFRLSTRFLPAFGNGHGYLMRCLVCAEQFHPGSLVSAENVDGARRVVHFKCRNT